MTQKLWKYKGYIIHAAGLAVCFLDPSVRHWLAGHLAYSGPGGLVWGWVQHWAQGK
jgi:hypothetical protein